MESPRSLSPLESGGWPFGTERPPGHPALDRGLPNAEQAPVEGLFRLELGASRPRPDRKTSGEASEERVPERASERAGEAAPRTREAPSRNTHTHNNAGRPEADFTAPDAPIGPSDSPPTPLEAPPGLPVAQPPAVPEGGLGGPAIVPTVSPSSPASARTVATGSAGEPRPVTAIPARRATATAAQPRPDGHERAPRLDGTVKGKGAERPAPAKAPDPERTEAVFRQLRMHISPGTRHAVIQLVPEDMGRISIRITVKGPRVTGEIRAESRETLEILEAHAPELRAVLAQSGFDTTDLSLARHGDESPRRAGGAPSPAGADNDGRAANDFAAPIASVLRDDRIDTYA